MQNFFIHNLPTITNFDQTKKEDQIIEFLGEDEETGVHSVKVIDNDEEDIWYYVDLVRIK